MVEIVRAPNQEEEESIRSKIFLAGSIDMGKAVNWQSEIESSLSNLDITIFNPRRLDWDCVDEETMAVTSNGIKKYSDIDIDVDELLTYNHNEDCLEYTKAEKINVHSLKNETLLEFRRGNDLFYFTEDHKVYSRKTSRHDNVGVYKANKWIDKTDPIRIPCGKKLNSGSLNGILGEDNLSDDHFKLYAWLLSEGSMFKKTNSESYLITIAQYIKNSEKVNRIKGILDRLELEYNYDNRQFRLKRDGVDFIKGYLGFEKYKLPDWIKKSTPEQKKIFIKEYGLGDGSYVNGDLQYIAFSKKYDLFCNEIQTLSFEAGLSTRKFYKTSGFGFPVSNIRYHNFNKKWLTMKYNKKINYTGKVWCPSTKNNSWIAYRNGTAFITGNSTWEQSIENPKFKEQVDWELDKLEVSDLIVIYFDKNGMAPITLLELGLYAPEKHMIVCCPDGYWRKGNVDIVCDRYGIKTVETLEDLINYIRKEYSCD